MRKKGKLVSLLLCLVLSLSLVISGCGEKEDDTSSSDSGSKKNSSSSSDEGGISGNVLFWHTYSDTEETIFNEQVLPAFNEEYPNIMVDAVRMPYDGLKQQLITAIAGESAPDAMRMDIIWVPEFAKMGALEPLNDYAGFDTIQNSVFEGPLNTNFYNGKFYGLPLNTNTKVALYNKAILDELGVDVPKTFDELVELSRKVKEQGLDDRWGIGLSGTHVWAMLPYFWTLGGKVTDDEYTTATGYVNSEASIKALEKIVALNDEGLIGPCILGEEPNTWGGIEASNYMMIDDGPWYYSIQKEGNPDIVNQVIPALIPEGLGGSRSVIGGEDVVMFGGSKNKEATWAFMQFLLSEKSQSIMAQTGLIPTVKAAANADEFKNDPINKVYVEQLETALPRTPHPKFEKIAEEFQLAVEKAIRKEGTPKDLLNDLAAKIDEALNE